MKRHDGKLERKIVLLVREAGELRLGALAAMLGLGRRKRRLRRLLDAMVLDGRLVRLRGGRYRSAERPGPSIEGAITFGRGGRAVVRADDGTTVEIARHCTGSALDGDRVLVVLNGSPAGGAGKRRRRRRAAGATGGRSLSGVVAKVIERRTERLTGLVQRRGGRLVLVPSRRHGPGREFRFAGKAGEPAPGKAVICRLERYEMEEGVFLVSLREVIGDGDAPSSIVAMVLAEQGIEGDFPPAALAEAERMARKVESDGPGRRRDLRSMTTFTIDGEDARDFDDALSVTVDERGRFRLFVHIADVSAFVPAGGALDAEAARRATSIYYPGGVVPMLPPVLSSVSCSLLAGRTRPCITCEILFAPDGRILRSRLYESLVESKARLTYELAQKHLDRELPPGRIEAGVAESLDILAVLTSRRKALRRARGGLDLFLPEPLTRLDRDGNIVDIRRREPLFTYQVVEECMLAANECVARKARRGRLPILFRHHPPPDAEKTEELGNLLAAAGVCERSLRLKTTSDWRELLASLQSSGRSGTLLPYVVRAQMRASYSHKPAGHFGLALESYCHFTSPIRRYPDLHTHRVLKASIRSARGACGKTPAPGEAPPRAGNEALALHCSTMERQAENIDREVTRRLTVPFARRFLGSRFKARISAVHPFGFFVETEDPFLQGLVPVAALSDDYYRMDDETLSLVGSRHRRRFTLGDEVDVILLRADGATHRLDFAPAGDRFSKDGR